MGVPFNLIFKHFAGKYVRWLGKVTKRCANTLIGVLKEAGPRGEIVTQVSSSQDKHHDEQTAKTVRSERTQWRQWLACISGLHHIS
ncbi:hypothetical protein ALC56_11153 [Trachymyrmex septentrionalis]|uniref:Uncharacterized protein n=1 Tax=Trachymyrmex septentrionalis TaxID=34720 RepID=A0A195F3K3_9HYME|nr:hypothetical protein ALC56_11153 [Trachymyrmex septentrionalis]